MPSSEEQGSPSFGQPTNGVAAAGSIGKTRWQLESRAVDRSIELKRRDDTCKAGCQRWSGRLTVPCKARRRSKSPLGTCVRSLSPQRQSRVGQLRLWRQSADNCDRESRLWRQRAQWVESVWLSHCGDRGGLLGSTAADQEHTQCALEPLGLCLELLLCAKDVRDPGKYSRSKQRAEAQAATKPGCITPRP